MLKTVAFASLSLSLLASVALGADNTIEESFFCKAKPEDEPYFVDVDAEKTCGKDREVVRTFYGVCHQRVQCAYISDATKKLIVELTLEEVFTHDFQKNPAEVPELFKEFKNKQLSNVTAAYNRLSPFIKDKAMSKVTTDIDWQRGVVTCRAVKVNEQPKCPPPDVCKSDQDFKSRNTATIRAAELDTAMTKFMNHGSKPSSPSSPAAPSSDGTAGKGAR